MKVGEMLRWLRANGFADRGYRLTLPFAGRRLHQLPKYWPVKKETNGNPRPKR